MLSPLGIPLRNTYQISPLNFIFWTNKIYNWNYQKIWVALLAEILSQWLQLPNYLYKQSWIFWNMTKFCYGVISYFTSVKMKTDLEERVEQSLSLDTESRSNSWRVHLFHRTHLLHHHRRPRHFPFTKTSPTWHKNLGAGFEKTFANTHKQTRCSHTTTRGESTNQICIQFDEKLGRVSDLSYLSCFTNL